MEDFKNIFQKIWPFEVIYNSVSEKPMGAWGMEARRSSYDKGIGPSHQRLHIESLAGRLMSNVRR
jgi:hypothetical protein